MGVREWLGGVVWLTWVGTEDGRVLSVSGWVGCLVIREVSVRSDSDVRDGVRGVRGGRCCCLGLGLYTYVYIMIRMG